MFIHIFLYVTIGKNITNISNAQGSLPLGIYANNDIITSFPDGAYNISSNRLLLLD